MEDRLKQLTEKIYNDGVKKGSQEADKVLSNAKEEAQKILSNAKTEAQIIVANAKREADSLKKKVESELLLSIKQAIGKLQNELGGLVTMKMAESTVQESFKDKEFIQKLILTTVQTWDKEGSQMNLALVLPKGQEADLSSFIKSSCSKQMDKGLQIIFSDGVHSGFQVKPKNGSFAIDFTDESFMSFVKTYLKPMTKAILFEEK